MSRTSSRQLTTTSYAILGLLAIRPWSTYELAKQMRRNLHYFWPRAESNLYAEPKRLVEARLAAAHSEPQGKRRRTVYRITPKGAQVLRNWLRLPSGGSRLESEPLVKLMFAEFGSKADILRTLRSLRADADTRRRHLRAIFEEYLRGEDRFPQRVHINVVAYRLLWAYAEVERHWTNWALDRVKDWRDTRTPGQRAKLMEALRSALDDADSGVESEVTLGRWPSNSSSVGIAGAGSSRKKVR